MLEGWQEMFFAGGLLAVKVLAFPCLWVVVCKIINRSIS